jgi:hypothetical protein
MAALFSLGRTVATPGALDLLRETGTDPAELLGWHTAGGKVWIITEADRSSTCLLLPSEY